MAGGTFTGADIANDSLTGFDSNEFDGHHAADDDRHIHGHGGR